MKISSVSDLHIEQYTGSLNFALPDSLVKNTSNSDVLVMAGDIMDTTMFSNGRVEELFREIASNYEFVIYVMGNHEHYGGDFAKTEEKLGKFFAGISSNICLLEKRGITIHGKRFFGGTMWTSFRNNDPNVMWLAKRRMNDYVWIKNSSVPVRFKVKDEFGITFHERTGNLLPGDVYDDHRIFLLKLQDDLEQHKDKDYILVTHHTPSFQLCNPMFYGDELNDLYHNNLDNLFYDHPNIKLACCGHTHGRYVVEINNANVVLNARGYPGEPTSVNFEPVIMEL